jgi:hypothetical protein
VSFEALRTGAVIRFPYLWAREAGRGETEGRKPRPVTVGVRIPKPKGEDMLVLFPITSHEPEKGRFAAEIPDTEKRRAGLDGAIRLWIILDEYNQDVIGRSFYLEPEPPLGYFSKAFLLPLLRKFIARRSKAKAVHRSADG